MGFSAVYGVLERKKNQSIYYKLLLNLLLQPAQTCLSVKS